MRINVRNTMQRRHQQRQIRLLYGGIGFLILLILWLSLPSLDARGGQAILSSLEATVPSAQETRRILILQHMPLRDQLGLASRRSHKLYARAWGYRYDAIPGDYTSSSRLHPSFNKQYVLRDIMERELARKDGAQWILWVLVCGCADDSYADADTIVYDPSVALHQLLPPDDLSPRPLILGSQDHNGFDNGAFLIRVTAFTLDLVKKTIAEGLAMQNSTISEQHFFGEVLRRPKVARHFFEIPQRWLNAYFPREGPQLHVHLVDRLKKKHSFRPLVQHSRTVYRLAAALARTQGDRGSGLASLPQYGQTSAHAREWWGGVVGGVASVKFLDEVKGKIIDASGEVLNP